MNNSDTRQMSGWHFLALWFGAAVSVAEILTGGILSPVGFKTGVISILAGHIIGTSLLALGGYMGAKTKLPSIRATWISFGKYGVYLSSVLNILQLIGWTVVMIISGSRSLNEISRQVWGFDNIVFFTVLTGLLICLWVGLGLKGVKVLNTAAVVLLLGLTVVLSTVIFKNQAIFESVNDNTLSFGVVLELNVVMPLSWLPLISDYTRFARSAKSAVAGSWLGYMIGGSWMYIIGLGLGIASGNADPGAAMVAANLGIFALGIVVLSTITTTFMDVYSTGVTALNLLPKMSEKALAVGAAVLSTIMALIVPMEQYENFLYAIGAVFGPLFAIVLTDWFIFKNASVRSEKNIDLPAVLVWAAGVAFYYIIRQFDFFLGTTLPVMLVTAVAFASVKLIISFKGKRGNMHVED
jgi:putative hydroxymethylpyrimidine transporter CytX